MQVTVYWNARLRLWSVVDDSKRVVERVKTITLSDCRLTALKRGKPALRGLAYCGARPEVAHSNRLRFNRTWKTDGNALAFWAEAVDCCPNGNVYGRHVQVALF